MAIYKARNTGMGNGMRGMREMFTRIPGNLIEDSGECYFFNILGNVWKDSGECSRTFRENVRKDSGECSKRFHEMFKKIPGNVQKDSMECSRRFHGMFKKIPGNLNLDLFCEILFIFYQILLWNCDKTKEYFLHY